MCPERCCLFISGKHIPVYPNVAMPCHGGFYTYGTCEVQRMTDSWVYKDFVLYLNI